jgi:type VI secretion system secreted protein Hcp
MAAVDYFLKIDGIDGESADAFHKGEIDVQSWSWAESRPASGNVAVSDFTFTTRLSTASPKLFLACAEGSHIKVAYLTARRPSAGAGGEYFLKYELSDVVVSSYQSGGAAEAADAPLDQVSLAFAKIEVEYKEQRPDGTFGTELKVGWDVKTNKKI